MLARSLNRFPAVGSLLLVAWLVVAPAGVAHAQQGAGTDASTKPVETPEASEEARLRIAETEAEVARLEALREEYSTRTAAFERARRGAPQVLAGIEAEVRALKQRKAPVVGADQKIEMIATELAEHELELALVRKEAADLEAEATGRAARRMEIPELLAAAKERLLALDTEKLATKGEPTIAEARRKRSRLQREVVEHEIESHQEELRSFEARGQLLALRRERAALRIAFLELQVATLRDALAAQRQAEAEVAAQAAERSLAAAEAMPPGVLDVVRTLATENRELALRRTGEDGLLRRIEDVSRKLASAEKQVSAVTADLELLQRHVRNAGLSDPVGLLLRRKRAGSPDVGMFRRFIRMRAERISEAQLEQIELAERRQSLADIDAILAETMAELEPVLSSEEREAAEALLRDLLDAQRRTLDILIGDVATYFELLVDFNARQQELVIRADALLRFIDERVLWIPSGQPLAPNLARDAGDALAWLVAPRFWGQVFRALGTSIGQAPLAFAVAVLFLLAAPFALSRIRSRVSHLGDVSSQPGCIRIEPTAEAFGLSLLLAAWGPGLLAFLSWRLALSVDATQFVRCFAYGLLAASFVWASLLLPHQLLRPRGIAEAHLGWPEAATHDLRRHLGWLTTVTVPAVFVIGMLELRGEDTWRESIGRLAFLVTMAAVLTFNHRVLRESRGALPRIAEGRGELPVALRLWRVLHPAALVVPVALGVAAIRGYTWTALQLAASFHVTLVFLYLVFIAHQLSLRWALLAGRRLELRRREETERTPEAKMSAAPGAHVRGPEEHRVDLATVDEHTGRLLRNAALLATAIGTWVIWADLLPVSGAMRSIELWSTTGTTLVETTNAAGEHISTVEERLVPTTLADLLLALVVGTVALGLARNLPGLLEVTVFRQLNTTAGERYAYATLGKYGVTLGGAVVALGLVGVGWSKIQWLLAAVGVGLGFGLQEIFANFISGLIILFERPIRVGDTVTVGDISGTVTKIRIRATWITGFDRKELVVPNKEFVTDRLVNWTLSDAVLRIEIPVGIAYGSDTEKACRVLQEVAEKHEHVLHDPAPYVVFRGFGDSSLSFELRVFSPDVAHYLAIVHELHMEIDRAFRAEGIEIAFPQRDLHLRSVPVAPGDAAATRA